MADAIESSLGAVFLSTNLHRTLQLISDISLVPLEQADLIKHFPNRELTFHLREELELYNFDLMDNVPKVFERYWNVEDKLIAESEKVHMRKIIDPKQAPRCLGQAIKDHLPESKMANMSVSQL